MDVNVITTMIHKHVQKCETEMYVYVKNNTTSEKRNFMNIPDRFQVCWNLSIEMYN
jgi:hypothetical protein